MNDKPWRAEIPIPAGASPREEAAIVADDPQFQAILRRSREQSERGEEVSIDEVLAQLDAEEARVSLKEAREHLADLYERAAAGQHVVIAAQGKPSVALVAAAELERLREIARRVTAET